MGPKKKFLAFKRKTSNKAEDQFIKVDGYLLSKDSRFFAWKDENNGYWCLIDYSSGLVIKRGFKTLKDVSDIDQKQAEKDLKQIIDRYGERGKKRYKEICRKYKKESAKMQK